MAPVRQPVNRGDRAPGSAHLVTTRAGTRVEGNLLAGGRQCVLVADVADQLAPCGVDVAGGLGDADLGEQVVQAFSPANAARTRALMLHMSGVRPVGHTDDRRQIVVRYIVPQGILNRSGVGLQPCAVWSFIAL